MKSTIIYPISLVALLLLFTLNTHAQSLSEEQKFKLEDKAEALLNDYELYGTLSETNRYISEEYVAEFGKLFYNDKVEVFNDLNKPEYSEEMVSIEDYLIKASQWFPEGITIQLTERIYGDPEYQDNGQFIMKVDFSKSVEGFTGDGNYLERKTYELSAAIVFDESVSDLKILSVRPFQTSLDRFVDDFDGTVSVQPLEAVADNVWGEETKKKKGKEKKEKKEKEPKAKKEKLPKPPKLPKVKAPKGGDFGDMEAKEDKKKEKKTKVPKSRNDIEGQGLFVGVNLGVDPVGNLQTAFSDLSSESGLSATDFVTQANLGISGGLEVYYYFTENLGVSVGLGYDAHSISNRVDSMMFSQSVTDIDNDPSRVLILWRQFEEKGNFPFLNAGLNVHYKQLIAGNLGIYGSVGAAYGFLPLNPYVTTTGNAEKAYLYSYDHPVYGAGVDELYAIDPLNLREVEYLDKYNIYNADIQPLRNDDLGLANPIIAKARLGITYALSNSLRIRLGGRVNWGINSILSGTTTSPEEWVDVVGSDSNLDVDNQYRSFLQQSDYLRIRGFGAELGIVLKL